MARRTQAPRRAAHLCLLSFGALALVSIAVEWKRPKAALPLAITILALATSALGAGGNIAYVGGHIRHKEFRFEQAPNSARSIRRDPNNWAR